MSKFKDFCTILPGYAFKSDSLNAPSSTFKALKITDIEPPFVVATKCQNVDISESELLRLEKYKVTNDDYVMAMTGATIGKVGRIIDADNYNLYINQRVCKFTPKTNCSKSYLYYVLTTDWFKAMILSNVDSTSAQPNIGHPTINEFEYILPDIKEQRRIANVLSALDKKIEVNNKIIKELEAMAKELYDYWFVQFDFPDAHGKPYRTNGGKMVYNTTLKREIPAGWEVETIESWIESEKGGDWGNDKVDGNYTLKVSCIRGADINGVNGIGSINAPTRFINKNNGDKLLSDGDIIIEISGGSPIQSTGRAALVTDAVIKRFAEPIICSNFCKAVTLKDLTLRYNFIYEWQRVYDSGALLGFEGKTSGIKNFLYDVFIKSYNVCTPPKDLRKRFVEMVNPINRKKHKILSENQELAELRNWLLPMLMNGQVTVSADSATVEDGVDSAKVVNLTKYYDQRFELWCNSQGLAARGNIDKITLREIFDAMDDDDK